ncbi:MAG: hypothetical protein ACI9QV_001421 [Methylophagaceae bacterium]
MTYLFSIRALRTSLLITAIGLLSACATTSSPSSVGSVNFGENPENYQEVVKEFLKKQPARTPLNLDKIEFLNVPNKFIFDQFSQEKFGYRACTLVHTDDARGLRAHFFLINNGEVVQHLHDSGIVTLSDKFCNIEMLALEKRASMPAVAAPQEIVDENGFKYITCQTVTKEVFFAFNSAKNQLIQQHDGQTIAQFDITKISDTFIVAEAEGHRISINRVSGSLLHQTNETEHQASCELTSQGKF